jgi:hypothetical protein
MGDHDDSENKAAAFRAAVLAMLRAAGLCPRLLKDDDGTTFIVLHGLEESRVLSEAMRNAIRTAMTAQAPPPRGSLHALH